MTGLRTQVGFAPESTYGTYAAPTRFLHALEYNVLPMIETVDVEGLSAGRTLPLERVTGATSGVGRLRLQVPRAGFGLILQHLMGGSVVPVQQATTAAYLQTHVLAENYGKSLTMQKSLVNSGATGYPFSGLGGKIQRAEFQIQTKGVVECSIDFDFKSVTEAQALATATYLATTNAALPFTFPQFTVKLGTYDSEAAVQGVKGMTITFERPTNADETFYAGNAGQKAQPNQVGFWNISGTFETDFVTKADFVDRFIAQSSTSLVAECVGPIIADTYAEMLRFRVPKIYFDGGVPEVGGPGLLGSSVPFKTYYDTNPTAIQYMSRDTTI